MCLLFHVAVIVDKTLLFNNYELYCIVSPKMNPMVFKTYLQTLGTLSARVFGSTLKNISSNTSTGISTPWGLQHAIALMFNY